MIAAFALAACSSRESQTLEAVIERGDAATWQLDDAAWTRIVVEPYRELYPEYAREYAIAPIPRGAVATRRHYADDPQLTVGQAWTRWALPVLAESYVATIDGKPLDAVFVRDGDHWRAITGLDRVIGARVTALDPSCPIGGATKQCRELAWQIADAALRTERSRFARACTLAAAHCGKPAP